MNKYNNKWVRLFRKMRILVKKNNSTTFYDKKRNNWKILIEMQTWMWILPKSKKTVFNNTIKIIKTASLPTMAKWKQTYDKWCQITKMQIFKSSTKLWFSSYYVSYCSIVERYRIWSEVIPKLVFVMLWITCNCYFNCMLYFDFVLLPAL